MTDDPHPEPLPVRRNFNIRTLITTPQGDASLLLTPEPIQAADPQAAFDKWLAAQSALPPEDIYRVIEAGTVTRYDYKHDMTGTYTEVLPPQ